MEATWKFWFWQEWKDEHERLWASRVDASEPSQARTQHSAALEFMWARPTMLKPGVSDLYADNGDGPKSIAEGRVRDLPASPG